MFFFPKKSYSKFFFIIEKQWVREELIEFKLRIEIRSRTTFLRMSPAPARTTQSRTTPQRQ